jgi:hypothetical protein
LLACALVARDVGVSAENSLEKRFPEYLAETILKSVFRISRSKIVALCLMSGMLEKHPIRAFLIKFFSLFLIFGKSQKYA